MEAAAVNTTGQTSKRYHELIISGNIFLTPQVKYEVLQITEGVDYKKCLEMPVKTGSDTIGPWQ